MGLAAISMIDGVVNENLEVVDELSLEGIEADFDTELPESQPIPKLVPLFNN